MYFTDCENVDIYIINLEAYTCAISPDKNSVYHDIVFIDIEKFLDMKSEVSN